VEELTRQRTETMERLNRILEERDGVEEDLRRVSSDLDEKIAETEKLQDELTNVKEEALALKYSNKNLVANLELHTKNLQEAQDKIAQADQYYFSLVNESEELKKLVESILANLGLETADPVQIEKSLIKLKETSSKYEDLLISKNEIAMERHELLLQIKKQKSLLDEAESQLSSLQRVSDEKRLLETKMLSLELEKITLLGHLDDLRQSSAEAMKRITQEKEAKLDEIESCERELSAQKTVIETLESNISRMVESDGAKCKINFELQAKLGNLLAEHESLTQAYVELNEKLQSVQLQFDDTISKNMTSKNELLIQFAGLGQAAQKLTSTCAAQARQIEVLKQSKEEMSLEIKRNVDAVQKGSSEATRLLNLCNNFEEENASSRKLNMELQTALENSEGEIIYIKEKLARKESIIQELVSKIEALKSNLARSSSNADELSRKICSVEEELAVAKAKDLECNCLQEALLTLNEAFDKCCNEKNILQRRLEESGVEVQLSLDQCDSLKEWLKDSQKRSDHLELVLEKQTHDLSRMTDLADHRESKLAISLTELALISEKLETREKDIVNLNEIVYNLESKLDYSKEELSNESSNTRALAEEAEDWMGKFFSASENLKALESEVIMNRNQISKDDTRIQWLNSIRDFSRFVLVDIMHERNHLLVKLMESNQEKTALASSLCETEKILQGVEEDRTKLMDEQAHLIRDLNQKSQQVEEVLISGGEKDLKLQDFLARSNLLETAHKCSKLQVEHLNTYLESFVQEITQSNRVWDSKTSCVITPKSEHQSVKAEIAFTEPHLKTLCGTVGKVVDVASSQQAEMQQLKHLVDDLTLEKEIFESRLVEQLNSFDTLSQENTNLTSEIIRSQECIEELLQKNGKRAADLFLLNIEFKDLQRDIDVVKTNLTALLDIHRKAEARYSAQLVHCQNECDFIKGELRNKDKICQEKEAEILEITSTLVNSQHKLSEMEIAIKVTGSDITNYQEEMGILIKKIQKLENELLEASSTISAMKAENSKLESLLQNKQMELTAACTARDGTICQLEQEILTNVEQIKCLQTTESELQSQTLKLSQELSSAQSRQDGLNATLLQNSQIISDLREENNALQGNIRDDKTALQVLTSKYEELLEELAQSKKFESQACETASLLQSYKRQCENLEREVHELQVENEESKAKIISGEVQLKNVATKCTSLEVKLNLIANERDSQALRLVELTQAAVKSKEAQQQSENELSILKVELNGAKQAKSFAESSTNSYRLRAAEMEKKIQGHYILEKELNELKYTVRSLEAQLTHWKGKAEESITKVRELGLERAALAGETVQKSRQLHQLVADQNEFDELKRQLRARDLQVQDLLEEIELLRGEKGFVKPVISMKGEGTGVRVQASLPEEIPLNAHTQLAQSKRGAICTRNKLRVPEVDKNVISKIPDFRTDRAIEPLYVSKFERTSKKQMVAAGADNREIEKENEVGRPARRATAKQNQQPNECSQQ
jgi:chromosome segregation ATPase